MSAPTDAVFAGTIKHLMSLYGHAIVGEAETALKWKAYPRLSPENETPRELMGMERFGKGSWLTDFDNSWKVEYWHERPYKIYLTLESAEELNGDKLLQRLIDSTGTESRAGTKTIPDYCIPSMNVRLAGRYHPLKNPKLHRYVFVFEMSQPKLRLWTDLHSKVLDSLYGRRQLELCRSSINSAFHWILAVMWLLQCPEVEQEKVFMCCEGGVNFFHKLASYTPKGKMLVDKTLAEVAGYHRDSGKLVPWTGEPETDGAKATKPDDLSGDLTKA